MPIIPVVGSLIDETFHAVKLARYAQLIGLPEDQFFGLNNSATLLPVACNTIWTHPERVRLAKYLWEAQEEIEQVTGYPLYPRWFYDEQHPYGYPVHTTWGKVIEAGFPVINVAHLAQAVSYLADPATVGPIATTFTDVGQVYVFHPGTTIPIMPSSVTITGGNLTIRIPWARLVAAANQANPSTGWDYNDIPPATLYETTVDVARMYTDDSIQGGLFWPHRATSSCDCECTPCCGTCSDYSVTACMYVRNPETGAVDLLDAAHGNDGWTRACSTCYCEAPSFVKMNYRAGLQTLTMQAEDAIIRLAHAKMPSPPCGCGLIQEMWARDRNTPEVLTSERLNCPFGLNDGSWVAWKFANAMRLQRGLAVG